MVLRLTTSEMPNSRSGCERFEPLEPVAQPEDVVSAAAEELAAEAYVEAAPAHEVDHEGIAGDKAAARQGESKRAEVERVAGTSATLGEVALEDDAEPALARPLERASLVGQAQPAGELAQKLEQRQVGARGRLQPV